MNSLDNYLRSFRRKAHLTQGEVAFLLGGEHGTTVLRHEESHRTPLLDTALRYSAVFSTDPRRLFAGRYERLEAATRRRAEALFERLSEERPDPRKMEFLQGLAATDIYLVPWDDE